MAFTLDFSNFDWVDESINFGLDVAIPGLGLGNIRRSVGQAETAYKKKLEKDLALWKCSTAPIEDLTPRAGMVTGALKGLNQGFRSEICKSIRNSPTARIAEALRFAKDILTGVFVAIVVAGVAFLVGVASAFLPVPFRFLVPKVMQWLVSSSMFLLNFNIQATDEALDRQGNYVALAGQAGGALGLALGWMACGIAPTAGLAVYNPTMAKRVMLEVGDEAREEIVEELIALVQTAKRQMMRQQFNKRFKNIRAFLKDPKNPLYPLLAKAVGQKTLDSWGNPGNKPWSINMAIEEYIESYQTPEIRAFLEEAWEEFIDGCQEGILVYANAYAFDVDLEKAEGKIRTIELED